MFAEYVANWILTFRNNISVPTPGQSSPHASSLKMGAIDSDRKYAATDGRCLTFQKGAVLISTAEENLTLDTYMFIHSSPALYNLRK